MNVEQGWILEWFEKDGDAFLGRADLDGVSVGWLQELFAESSIDEMMCLSYSVDEDQLNQLRAHVAAELDPERFDYFLSGWAMGGFRTPAGLYPPPKDPPTFIQGARRVRPRLTPC